MFVSGPFSGTYSAALREAVERSGSRMFEICLTPLSAVKYTQSIGTLLERKFFSRSVNKRCFLRINLLTASIVPTGWLKHHMWNLLSSLEYIPKLMVASLCIIAHVYTLKKNKPSVLSPPCGEWKCNLADLKIAVTDLSESDYNTGVKTLKAHIGRKDLDLVTSTEEWLPGAHIRIQASDVSLPLSLLSLSKTYVLFLQIFLNYILKIDYTLSRTLDKQPATP